MGYLPLTFISMLSLGVYYFLVKIISVHVASPVILLIGTVVAFLVIYLYLYSTKTRMLPERKIYIARSLIISIPLVIALLMFYLALARGPISVVMPVYGLNAMVTAFLGIFISREKVSIRKWLGLVMAIAAIALLSR
jgi:transporter family protein